nr:serine hydrolase [Escherichia coli]
MRRSLDRTEPTLNTAIPRDPRDTTTRGRWRRRCVSLRWSCAGRTQRAQLVTWLKGNTTAQPAFGGLPTSWTVGDKTGSGGYGTTNDIAVIWPQGRAPLFCDLFLPSRNRTREPPRCAGFSARIIAEGL